MQPAPRRQRAEGPAAALLDEARFGSRAEARAKQLGDGRTIVVTGRLAHRGGEAVDGTRRSKHYVIGRVESGGGRANGGEDADADPTEAVAD